MAGKTSKASTQPPGEALSPKHEAFVQAYIINGLNGAKAYREVYPNCKSAHAAEQAASRLLKNVEVAARIAEIMRAGAERAEITIEKVLRELAVLGFSDIGKVVRWRPEVVYEEFEDADNPDQPARARHFRVASWSSTARRCRPRPASRLPRRSAGRGVRRD
jgi:Terminase small subunit